MITLPKNQSGVTLVELIVTVTVLGILAAAGTPSLTKFVRNIGVKSISESVHQGLQMARAEAVRRNTRVRFVIAADTSWTVSTDSGTTIQSKPAKEGAGTITATFTPSNSTRVTFNSYGRVTTNADASAALTQIDFNASNASVVRRVKIDAGGRLNMCDPGVSVVTDPLKC
jgi:type IV fimbrial biogenesis protein FimT